MVQVDVPVEPCVGFTQVNDGPATCVAASKVALAGTALVSSTAAAASGPRLMTVTRKTAFWPGKTSPPSRWKLLTETFAAGSCGSRTAKTALTLDDPSSVLVLTTVQ